MLRAPFTHSDVIAAWSQTVDGNMMPKYGPDPATVNTNRDRFLASLGLTQADCARLAVTQGTADRIRVVGRDIAGQAMDGSEPPFYCDAFITTEPGLALWLLIGDCIPIMFFDSIKPRIALAHCGFASTDLRLAAKVVSKLRELGTDPTQLQVVLGPGIKPASYVFPNDRMKPTGPEWGPYLAHPDPGHTSIDIYAYNVAQLIAAGVPRANIQVSPVDTAADPAWFSHVRAGRTGQPEGRFAAVIALPKPS